MAPVTRPQQPAATNDPMHLCLQCQVLFDSMYNYFTDELHGRLQTVHGPFASAFLEMLRTTADEVDNQERVLMFLQDFDTSLDVLVKRLESLNDTLLYPLELDYFTCRRLADLLQIYVPRYLEMKRFNDVMCEPGSELYATATA